MYNMHFYLMIKWIRIYYSQQERVNLKAASFFWAIRGLTPKVYIKNGFNIHFFFFLIII